MSGRRIGSLEVSVVGLGCNNFGRRCDDQESAAVVHAAIDAGVTMFDTADIYDRGRSEEFLGEALHGVRDEVVVATKFGGRMIDDPGMKGGNPKWVRKAVDGSLRRLDTDRIDLYQMHFPDADVPIVDTLGALNELVRAGKVIEIGCSNFSGEQIDEATAASMASGGARFVSAQNNYNLLARDVEKDVLPACARHELGMIPYFPLANGLLTGKYRRGAEPPKGTRLAGASAEQSAWIMSERNFDVVERLEAFVAARDRTLLELAISWLAVQPLVACVIAGATRPEQVKANAGAAGWVLSAEELAEVDAITAA